MKINRNIIHYFGNIFIFGRRADWRRRTKREVTTMEGRSIKLVLEHRPSYGSVPITYFRVGGEFFHYHSHYRPGRIIKKDSDACGDMNGRMARNIAS